MAKRVGVISLGCAKNRVDTEHMLGILSRGGYHITNSPDAAEVLIVNTCGFIEPAKQESIAAIFELAEYKKSGICETLVVTGCLSQRYSRELFNEIPEIDIMLGTDQYESLPAMLDSAADAARQISCGRNYDFMEGRRILTTPPYSAYIKIGDGCDNRCAYCAIPLIRGEYRSRPMHGILGECTELARGGVKELTLISQDTTRYNDEESGSRLPELIKSVAEIRGVSWVRALYCYPSRVDDRLLDTLAGSEKICKYLDIPIQHINDDMLRAMNRSGGKKQIKSVLNAARERGIFIRTTVIVGFPGETQDIFKELYDFIGEFEFDRLGAFAYSPESDTPALKFPQQVPQQVKQQRLDEIMSLQRRISNKRNKLRVGTVCDVLTETAEAIPGRYTGRSQFEAPEGDGEVRFSARAKIRPGDIVKVKITTAYDYDVAGEAIE